MKKIFFVTYGGGHANIVELLTKELVKNDNFQIEILALTSAFEYLKKTLPNNQQNLSIYALSDLMHLFNEDNEKIKKFGQNLLQQLNSKQTISKEETINYMGLSFFDLAVEIGEEEAQKKYLKEGRRAFKPVKSMETILKFIKPDVVVATTSPRFESASLIASNKLKIPSVQILDVFSTMYNGLEGDNICCFDTNSADKLSKIVKHNQKIYVTGQPVIEESLKKISQLNKKNILKKLGLAGDEPTVLLATQKLLLSDENNFKIGYADNEVVYKNVLKELNKLHKKTGSNILLRIHPVSESKNFYKDLLKKFTHIKYVNDIISLHESIAVSDIVVSHSSTVAMEAAYSGRETFTFRHVHEQNYPIPEFKEKPFNFLENEFNICSQIETYIQKNKSLQPNSYDFKDSVNRIIDVMRSLMC